MKKPIVLIVALMLGIGKTHAQGTALCGTNTPVVPEYYWQMESAQTCTSGSGVWSTEIIDVIRYQRLETLGITSLVTGQVGSAKSSELYNSGANYCRSVGNWLRTGINCGSSTTVTGTANNSLVSGFTLEFILKPDPDFGWTGFNANYYIYNTIITKFRICRDGPYFQIIDPTNTSNTIEVSTALIYYPGELTPDYIYDGNWHHFALVFDGLNHKMQIWIDGRLSPALDATISWSSAYFPEESVEFNNGWSMFEYKGLWDEFAAYKSVLSPELIYQHYTDMLNGVHYNYCTAFTATDVPAQFALYCTSFDTADYAPSYVNSENQLKTYPLPRYQKEHGLKRNFPWMDIEYLGREPVSDTIMPSLDITMCENINLERAKKWNYYLELPTPSSAHNAGISTSLSGHLASQANTYPDLPTSTIIFRHNWNSNATAYSIDRTDVTTCVNPTSLNGMHRWGDTTARTVLDRYLVKYLTRPLNFINEDDEDWTPNAFGNTASNYDRGNAAYQMNNAFLAGLLDTNNYSTTSMRNANYSRYQSNGFNPAVYPDWAQNRSLQAWNYATIDVYPGTPKFWWYGGLAGSNAFSAFQTSRYNEIALGDSLCSPFVTAGWSYYEENNLRPAQYLALLKAMGILGADFYYPSYFNVTGAGGGWPNAYYDSLGHFHVGRPNDPAGYMYQAAMPSYAQAITSKYEYILKHSTLLPGIRSHLFGNIYFEYTHPSSARLIHARKLQVGGTGQDLYLINGSLMHDQNCSNSQAEIATQKIDLTGALYGSNPNDELTFNITRQGSTYVYDRRDTSNIIFYQLDGWHESKHPYYWNKDFWFEAELNDYTDTVTTAGKNDLCNNTMKLKTERPSGAALNDYSEFTTYLKYDSLSPKNSYYYLESRNNDVDFFVWVRARATSDAPGGVADLSYNASRSGYSTSSTITCITNDRFKWYRYGVIVLPKGFETQLEFTGNKYIEFDKFIIADALNDLYNGVYVASVGYPVPKGIDTTEIGSACFSSRPLSISEKTMDKSGLIIHPNPNGGKFTVSTKSSSSDKNDINEIRLFNLQGQLVHIQAGNTNSTSVTIDAGGLNNGAYIAEITTTKGIYRRKIIIAE